MKREEKLKKLEGFGLIDPDVSEVVKEDFEELLKREHEKVKENTANYIRIIKDLDIVIDLT